MTNQKFTRQQRLLNPKEFQRVLEQPTLRATQQTFLLLARENALPVARIGFVLSKRRVRLAVARNRAKRIIRESFRRQNEMLCGLDVVVMARDGLATLTSAELRVLVERQFQYLAKKRVPVPANPVCGNAS